MLKIEDLYGRGFECENENIKYTIGEDYGLTFNVTWINKFDVRKNVNVSKKQFFDNLQNKTWFLIEDTPKFERLEEIELIEFDTKEVFTGFSKAEAAQFIKQNG